MIFAAAFLLNGTWILLQWGVASTLGIEPTRLSLGYGPRIWTRGRFQLALLPLGGYVAFKEDQLAATKTGRSVLMTLTPWLLFAGIVIAAGARIDDFVAGATLIVRITDVWTHWDTWTELLTASPLSSLARLGARLVALNLLPLSPLAGGAIITRVLPEKHRQKFSDFSGRVVLVLFAIGLLRPIVWLIGLVAFGGH